MLTDEVICERLNEILQLDVTFEHSQHDEGERIDAMRQQIQNLISEIQGSDLPIQRED